MSADTIALAITEPGIYEISEQDYHADPVPGGSLSSTGARKLLPPSCPALFRWQQDHPEPPKAAFDFGTAAHRMVLGTGYDIKVLDYENWRTKASQDAAKEARAVGQIPLLTDEYREVCAMAGAIRHHPIASAALDPARGGRPEQSLFAQDEQTGVWLRARLDWMPDPMSSLRPVIFDYKTTKSARPEAFAKSVADFGYHVQAALYSALYYQLTGVDAPFLFIAQDKEPPYLVTVCQLDADAMRAGREQVRRAIEIYRDCKEANIWPGWADDITVISLPYWARTREDF